MVTSKSMGGSYSKYILTDYEDSLIEKLKYNNKFFHHYVNSKKVTALSVSSLKLPDGIIVENCSAMVNIWVNSFALVYKRVPHS